MSPRNASFTSDRRRREPPVVVHHFEVDVELLILFGVEVDCVSLVNVQVIGRKLGSSRRHVHSNSTARVVLEEWQAVGVDEHWRVKSEHIAAHVLDEQVELGERLDGLDLVQSRFRVSLQVLRPAGNNGDVLWLFFVMEGDRQELFVFQIVSLWSVDFVNVL